MLFAHGGIQWHLTHLKGISPFCLVFLLKVLLISLFSHTEDKSGSGQREREQQWQFLPVTSSITTEEL